MRIRVSLLCVLMVLTCAVQALPEPLRGTRHLPEPPDGSASRLDSDYRLVAVSARGPDGQVIDDVPAFRIALNGGFGDWVAADSVPTLKRDIPAKLRAQLALYLTPLGDWLVVPRDWKIFQGALGGDGGTDISFVAPAGIRAGWMHWTAHPACVGCIYAAAESVFPQAHRRLDELLSRDTPEPLLSPNPERLKLADRCTANLAWRSPGSPPVRAIMYLVDDPYDAQFRQLVIASAPSRTGTVDLALAEFRESLPSCDPVTAGP